jgi:adenylate cyclase class 2
MNIEYEATFININKDEMRRKLKDAGAVLVRPEFLQRRIPFFLPDGDRTSAKYVRVRDEGDKITLSFKIIDGDKIENQRELCLEVNSFDGAVELLGLIGCEPKSYQESRRELWRLDEVDITIDEWPFLEPFVEVEGKFALEVQKVSEKIGFDYSQALFCGVTKLYILKYNLPYSVINTVPRLVFDMGNPFLNMV